MLKLILSSDWHYGRRLRDRAVFDQLMDAIESERPDGVLVLGDIANEFHPKNYRIVFPRLAALGCPVGVLVGNHDVWLGSHARGLPTSWDALAAFAGLAEEHGITCLDLASLRIGDVFVAGTLGWYDYSLGSPLWSTEQYAKKQFERGIWNDGKYVRWLQDDDEVCHRLLASLEASLARRPDDTVPLVVTHVAAMIESVAVIGRPLWDFFNAYMGTTRLGELLERHAVPLHFHGHLHSDHIPIPEVATHRRTDLTSYNACFYLHRPYLVAEWKDGAWSVRAGEGLG